jgi:hypothetical protein
MKEPLRVSLSHINIFVGLDGETELSRRGTEGIDSVSGKGSGGSFVELRQAWDIILAWAKEQGLSYLYCEPTQTDGRGSTRRRVYSRAGFLPWGDYLMRRELK